MISGFCRKVDENCALLGYYAASSSNSLPFWDNLSSPSSRDKNPRCRWDQQVVPQCQQGNYHYSLCNSPEERSSQTLQVVTWYSNKRNADISTLRIEEELKKAPPSRQ